MGLSFACVRAWVHMLFFFLALLSPDKKYFKNVPSLSGIQNLSSVLLRSREPGQSPEGKARQGEVSREQSGDGSLGAGEEGGGHSPPCEAAVTWGPDTLPSVLFWTHRDLTVPSFFFFFSKKMFGQTPRHVGPSSPSMTEPTSPPLEGGVVIPGPQGSPTVLFFLT